MVPSHLYCNFITLLFLLIDQEKEDIRIIIGTLFVGLRVDRSNDQLRTILPEVKSSSQEKLCPKSTSVIIPLGGDRGYRVYRNEGGKHAEENMMKDIKNSSQINQLYITYTPCLDPDTDKNGHDCATQLIEYFESEKPTIKALCRYYEGKGADKLRRNGFNVEPMTVQELESFMCAIMNLPNVKGDEELHKAALDELKKKHCEDHIRFI